MDYSLFAAHSFYDRKGDPDAAISVLTQCSLALSRSIQGVNNASDSVLPFMADSFTQLAKWLRNSTLKDVDTLKELADADVEDDGEALVGKLMQRASVLCPTSSEAWLSWGHYQYASSQEKLRVEQMLSSLLPVEEVSRISKKLDEQTDIKQTLSTDNALNKKPGLLKRIIEEVDNRQLSAKESYAGALKSFLKFLRLEGANGTHRREAADVTLRVLRILSREIRDDDPALNGALMEEVGKIHPSVWRPIVPQLFSLLQHGQPWLREFICRLLSHLAAECPEELVFPVAVGAAGLAWSWSTGKVSYKFFKFLYII